MCRLFGLHAGTRRVQATFWLLTAPDSLSAQSRREPDGTGIGIFDPAGAPLLSRQPIAAWQDIEFARAARDFTSSTFLAHVRYARTGVPALENTHPFEQDRRLFAHNGGVGRLELLEERLIDLAAAGLVRGQTDSERVFALITAETRRHGGDVTAGITAALAWVADRLPMTSLNLIITTATELWALRYPEIHRLYVLQRPASGTDLEAVSRRISARSQDLAGAPAVVIASERMDDDAGWRLLEPGELLHVGPGLKATSSFPLPEPPRFPMTARELYPGTGPHPD